MTDEIATIAAEVSSEGDNTSEVTQPNNSNSNDSNAKPYDDEVFDSYVDDAPKEESVPAQTTPILPTEEKPEVKEEVKAEEKLEGGKERKGDTVDDGFEDLPIKKIINGKEVQFKVKDAIQAYTQQQEFNRNVDKRLSVVAEREQKWEQSKESFKSTINNLLENHIAKGDFIGSVRGLAKIALNGTGSDPVEFEKMYFAQLDKVRDVYTKMTPAEQQAYWADQRAKLAEAKVKDFEQKASVSEAQAELQNHVNSLQQAHGVESKEFWTNYKNLVEKQTGEGKPFKHRDDVKAEDVIRYTLALRHEEKVVKAGEAFGIDDDTILDEVSKVTASHPEFTVEDIVKVFETAGFSKRASQQVVENLNRKVPKGAQFNKASSTKKDNEKVEGYDKEDLDFLYRKQARISRPTR